MKIAWFQDNDARFGAICGSDLCRTLEEQGHVAKVYARSFDHTFPDSIKAILPETGMETQNWWKKEGIDLAIFYRLGVFKPRILKAAKEAGAVVCLECDSDGYVSPRQGLVRQLRLRFSRQFSLRHQLGSWKVAVTDWLHGHKVERTLFDSIEFADAIKIESQYPADILASFLRAHGKAHLAKKLVVIPFAVRELFTTSEIQHVKEPRIVVAGRLGSPQKDPELLLKLVTQLAERMPTVEIELHSRGVCEALCKIDRRYSNVKVNVDSSPSHICSRLAASQVLLSTSRWETTPIIGLEALCMGCTLVAPKSVPGYRSLVQDGGFGTLFESNRQALDAIARELEIWKRSGRDPVAISNHWRKYCELSVVARQFVRLIPDQVTDVSRENSSSSA